MKRLIEILKTKRPHGSTTITEIVESMFADYDYEIVANPLAPDDPLALLIRIGDSTTLFSCHLDTVHHSSGEQEVVVDEGCGIIFTAQGEGAKECLGADNGAGMWLMLELVDAGVPGTYYFHYGEECGGLGSYGIASHFPDTLAEFDRAVAFDRRGNSDVITHQGGQRCCSDEFAAALAEGLNAQGLLLAPCANGVFTDTANYIAHIAECTNVSCGYQEEHRSSEYLDYEYLFALRSACIAVDWELLPTVRIPNKNVGLLPDYPEAEDLACLSFAELKEWVEGNPSQVAMVLYEALGMIDEGKNAWGGAPEGEDLLYSSLPDYM